MASYNQVVLMGNLTRDVELRYTPAGTPVAKMGLAMNRRYRGKDEQLKEETTFVDVSTFGKTAEIAQKYLSKGTPVLIGGRLHFDRWKTPQGETRSKLEVICEDLRLLPRREGGGTPGGTRSHTAAGPIDGEPQPDPFTAEGSGFPGHETFATEADFGEFGREIPQLHEPAEAIGEFDPTPQAEPADEAPVSLEKSRGRSRRRAGGDA